MKKPVLLLAPILAAFVAGPAYCDSFSLSIGQPAVVEPAPVYAAPEPYPPTLYSPGYVEYYNRWPSGNYDHIHHHRHYANYWAHERREHNEHDWHRG